MTIETITAADGTRRVILDQDEYEAIIDARDHAIALRQLAAGAPLIPDAEMDAFLQALSPLAFFRERAGLTQAALAAASGITQPFLAQIERGTRDGSVSVLLRIAKALGVRIEDLVEEAP
ncbi:helix-turn-helix domain-containing protein [Granulibacter bethesdensis]|uniref:helix-turn-helix domain-containing protein n=1 Tax=Granulibacter bethesdensis TaxID=364410 RepID=UPI0003F1EA08|nr:helix-turn-helix transcriptional regulator [Granulibacter bethesdensis]AHJ66347.1 hypothetical protein GbCGDNIH4_7188 [Granulibacter bethesdensis CGDNIH4]